MNTEIPMGRAPVPQASYLLRGMQMNACVIL
jgi:hypothetical protein